MGDTFKLALQLTMIDMLSGVADRAKKHILNLGEAGNAVKHDFDQMASHITKGLQGIAVAHYGWQKLQKGIAPAADLQEAMIDVRMNLMRSGQDAAKLNAELDQVRSTAVDLQKITPFSAQDVVKIQNELISSGVEFDKVVGKGATRAALMLATITKGAPDEAASAMLSVGVPYQLKGEEYLQVADVLQKHILSGRMKLPAWEHNLPRVAGIAHQFKVPWEDMVTGLAVIGEQGFKEDAGTYLKDFYERLTGSSRISRKAMLAINQQAASKGLKPLEFWDKKGEMLPMKQIIDNMRGSLGKLSTHEKMFWMSKIFGEQGGQGAVALMSEGTGSWEFIKNKNNEVADSERKITERLKGFNTSVTTLSGTTKTTLATMFDPMLQPLTVATQKMNDLVDGAGRLAAKHPTLTRTGNAIAGAGVLAAGAYGAWHLLRGGISGGRVLRGLKGIGGSALGIAEGKAVQAATGVSPVFVTNWPANLGGGAVKEMVEVAGGGALLTRARGLLTASGAVLSRFSPHLAAFGGGYAVGKYAINPMLGGISGWATNGKYKGEGWMGEQIYDLFHPQNQGRGGQQLKNDIKVEINFDEFGRAMIKTRDMNTSASINSMRRGSFMSSMESGLMGLEG